MLRPAALLSSFGFICRYALGVALFLLVRLLRLGAPLGSLRSFGFAWFVRVRPGDRCVRSGSSCSNGCALRVAGLMRLLRLVVV